MIKIQLKDIRPEGVVIHDQIDEEVMEFTKEELFRFIEPLEVDAKVEKFDEIVLAKTNVKTRYTSFCSRCLVEVEKDWIQNFTLDFPLENNPEFIELGEDIRQEIVLSLPTRILCKEDCQGICMDCGVDLNFDPCKCKKNHQDIEN